MRMWVRSSDSFSGLGSGVAVAVIVAKVTDAAPIRLLAQELPYASGAAIKRKKNFLERKFNVYILTERL